MVFMEEVAVKLVADKFPVMHRDVNNNELKHKLDRVRKLIRCDKVFHITTTKGGGGGNRGDRSEKAA